LRYLNGQLTQDLKKLTPTRALPACVTTAKGRLQAEVWVSLGEDVLVMDAAPELHEVLPARLERYIVADDVTLEDRTGEEGLFHCVGLNPADHPVLGEFPATHAARLGEDGWDVRVPQIQLSAVRTALGTQLASAALWERLRVERGIPQWGSELTEDTLPPEAGLERTHIDYHKGCYIGQEVISRLKSVGHVNRTLCRFRGEGHVLPEKGAALYVAGAEGIVVGTLTSVVAEEDGFFALGYVKRGHTEATFSTEAGIRLQRLHE
jgi:folate-binding protein YgfZ